MTKEVKIIIKADGSYAIEELRKTSTAVADLGKSGKQIEPLDKELNEISDAASDLSQAADKAGKNIDKLDKELADVAKTSDNAGKNLDGLETGLQDVDKSANKAGKTLGEARSQIENTSRSMKSAGQETSFLERSLGNFGLTLKKAGSEIRGFQAEIGEFTFAANQSLELLEKTVRYVQMGYDFSKQGAQLKESRTAFDDYARSVGKSADEILNKLRNTSGNTINDMSLIKTASAAMSLGVTNDADKMANLLEIARNKARLKGIETQQAFEDIVTGIGRASPQILDNLSIRIPAAFEQMTEGMSDAQKVAVLFEMTLKEGNAELEGMGGMADSSADSFRQLETSWTNLKTSGGELVTNVFEPINVVLAIGMDKAAGLLKSFDDLFTYILNIDKENPIKNMTEAELLEALSDREKLYDEYKSGFAKTLGEVDSPANSFRQSSSLGVTEKVGKEMQNAFFEQNMLAAEKKVEQINAELNRRSKAVIETTEKTLKNQADAFAKMLLPGFNPNAVEPPKEREKRLNREANDLKRQQQESERRTKDAAREAAERQKNLYAAMVTDYKQSVIEISKIDDPVVKFHEASELAEKSASALATALGSGSGHALYGALSGIKDAAFDAEAGMFDLLMQTRSYNEELDKWLKEVKEIEDRQQALSAVVDLLNTIGSHDFLETAKNLTPDGSPVGAAVVTASMMDFWSGGLMSGKGKFAEPKKAIKEIENPIAETVASAVSDGFRRADFSGFLTSLGSGLSGVVGGILTDTIQSAISGKNTGGFSGGNSLLNGLFKPIYTKNGAGKMALNWSNLGSNFAIGGAVSFLTSPGRLFGGSVIHGQENFNTSSSLNDQVTQAKELRDQLYIQAGITEATRKLLEDAQFAYTWVRKTKSGNGITSKKTTTYLLEGSAEAQSSINNIKSLQEAVMGEQAARSYDLWQLSRNDSVKALQLSADDAKGAYDASLALKSNSPEVQALRNQQEYYRNLISNVQVSTAQQAKQTKGNYNYYQSNMLIGNYQQQIAALQAQIEANSGYKYSEAERTAALKAYEQAKIDLVSAKEAGRTNLMSPFLSSTTLASLTTSDILSQMLGDKSLSDSSGSIQAMLPLLKQAGMADMNIAQMYADAGSDPTKLYDAGKAELSNLEKALAVYEQIWKDAEQEALDASKTIEEQNAAFERFQTAQDALLQTKDAILQKEQELAAIEKQKLESQRNAQIETALSAIGELDKRGDRMIILSDNDAIAAIDALLEEFADNPEVTAMLQKKRQTEVARAKWGSMA